MSTINNLLSRLDALDVKEEAGKFIENVSGTIADLNRERMLAGRRADGSVMPNYSRTSVEVYGYPAGPIMLKATGAFQRAINIKVQGESFETDSADSKSGMLKERYSESIFGMDKDGKIELVAEKGQVFVNQVKEKLSL